MQALILAAGRGSRLGASGQGLPKCLLQLEDATLLEYQLAILKRFNVQEVCVVLGYRAGRIVPYLKELGCVWRINERFAETNSLHSLSLAIDFLRSDFLLCNSDVLADPRVYHSLVKTAEDVLAFDSNSGDDAEHMKVDFGVDGSLQQIGKSLSPVDTNGENVGLMKLTEASIAPLREQVGSALEEDGERQWATAAIDRLARSRRITGLDIDGLPWVEIDFAEDLDYARSTVWPQIGRGNGFEKCWQEHRLKKKFGTGAHAASRFIA